MHWEGQIKDRRKSPQMSALESEAAASLPQRIGQSASGLLKESFKTPSPRVITSDFTSLSTGNTKAGSSSSSTDKCKSSLAFCSPSQNEQATFDQSESFRSNEKCGEFGTSSGQVACDEFLAGPIGLGNEVGFLQDPPRSWGHQQAVVHVGAAEDDLPQVQEPWKIQDESHDFTDRNNDGAAVVALLSDPAFTVDEEPTSTRDLETGVTEAQLYERLHTGEVPAKNVDTLRPSNTFDLIPDFRSPWNPSHAFPEAQEGTHERGHFLEPRSGEVQPWIDILDAYRDEVWGEMLPLVQEAREELRAVNEKRSCLENSPATRRLKMILQHLGIPRNR